MKNVKKKKKTCNTKVLTTEEDDDDLLQSYTDKLTINEVSEEKDHRSDNDQHINNEVSAEKYLIIEKKIYRFGALRRKQKIWIKNQKLSLSKNKQIEGDGDDLVDTDAGTDTDMSENNSGDQAKHHDLHRTLHSLRIGHDDLSVDTVIDLDSKVTKKNWVLLLFWQQK